MNYLKESQQLFRSPTGSTDMPEHDGRVAPPSVPGGILRGATAAIAVCAAGMTHVVSRRGWRRTVVLVACGALLAATAACGADSPEQVKAAVPGVVALSGGSRSPDTTSAGASSVSSHASLPSISAPAAPLPSVSAPAGSTPNVPVTYGFTGTTVSVQVPADATAVQFSLAGGSGGNASGGDAGRGGYGAVISGTIAVIPGATVTIAVGGQGGHYGTNPENTHGGWGQFPGGAGGVNTSEGGFGAGGGGGATSLTVDGALIAVAGGGGGGGVGFAGYHGGDGGASGVPAHNGNTGNGPSPGKGGHAGTQAGGTGAAGDSGGKLDSPGGGGGGGLAGGAGGSAVHNSAGGGGSGTCMTALQVISPTAAYGTSLGNGHAALTWYTTD